MATPKITVLLEDGSELVWYPGQETKYAVEGIESFLGPCQEWSEPVKVGSVRRFLHDG